MIPKKIHYCWFGRKPLPNSVKKCIKSWKKYCPDYEIIRWDENNFDINCNDFVKQAYEKKAWAFVSDYARLHIIYENGGIYLDTDVEILKNIDDLLKNKCFFPIQQDEKLIATGLGFASEKNFKVIKEMMDIYENINFDKCVREQIACPILNTKVLKKYGYQYSDKIQYLYNGEIVIYPSKYFDPIAPGKTKILLDRDSYSIHHYSATWMNSSVKLKRKIINMIGQYKINKLKIIVEKWRIKK